MAPNLGGSQPRILFLYPIEASFIDADLELLKSLGIVTAVRFGPGDSFLGLLRSVARADLVYAWFALEHAAVSAPVARLLGRKSIVVAGGWDVVGFPEIGYGRLLTARGRFISRTALLWADRVLAFSEWSARAIRRVASRSRVQVVYPGIDVSRFRVREKERLVVTVAHVSRENLKRKGLEAFVRTARLAPESRFVLVGRHWDDAIEILRGIASDNVSLPGWLSDEDLRALLSRASVYVQCSYTEGFGVALAEAMASGCVPVVTRDTAMEEVVGDTGFYVPYGDTEGLTHAIRDGLSSDLGREARNRVERRFSLHARQEKLREAVHGLLGNSA